MECGSPDSQVESDTVFEALMQASSCAGQGDFRAARLVIERARALVSPIDLERLDAFDKSFRLDRAVGLVVAAFLVALAVIAVLSLLN